MHRYENSNWKYYLSQFNKLDQFVKWIIYEEKETKSCLFFSCMFWLVCVSKLKNEFWRYVIISTLNRSISLFCIDEKKWVSAFSLFHCHILMIITIFFDVWVFSFLKHNYHRPIKNFIAYHTWSWQQFIQITFIFYGF